MENYAKFNTIIVDFIRINIVLLKYNALLYNYQVSKFIHSSILLVKRGSRDSHEIQLLTA